MKVRLRLLVLPVLAVAVPLVGNAYTPSGHTWSTRTVPYYINPANADVPAADALKAIQQAALAWTAQSNADFAFYYMGKTSGASFQMNRKNEVFFRNGSNGSLVAETMRWYNAAGVIEDADIAFYDAAHLFTTTATLGGTKCSGRAMVIENFATHEFGHALGLSHSTNPAATMYPSSKACATDWVTLDEDDLAGVEALYPSSRSNTAPSVVISTPAAGATTSEGARVAFAGSASDKEDGNISAEIVWTSNLDGVLGTGAKVTSTLSPGTHVVTAAATDSGGATSSGTVSIVVTGSEAAAAAAPFNLSVTGFLKKGLQRAQLDWSGATGAKVEVYRNGVLIATKKNSGQVVDAINATGSSSYAYRVCERGATRCSPKVTVKF